MKENVLLGIGQVVAMMELANGGIGCELRHADGACARRDSQLPPQQHHRSDGTVILCSHYLYHIWLPALMQDTVNYNIYFKIRYNYLKMFYIADSI